MSADLLVVDLGRREYGEVWRLQRRLVEARAAGGIGDVLLLLEHPHVITLGRRGRRADVFTTDLPVFEIERGGEATYHGPGQLVGYPILGLGDRLEVRRLVTDLEEVLIRASRDVGVAAHRNPAQRGVWVGPRKVGSIGLAIHRGVTYHGFAHNVTTDLAYFGLLRPCGHAGDVMTSLARELGRPVAMEAVKEAVVGRFGDVLRRDVRLGKAAEVEAVAA